MPRSLHREVSALCKTPPRGQAGAAQPQPPRGGGDSCQERHQTPLRRAQGRIWSIPYPAWGPHGDREPHGGTACTWPGLTPRQQAAHGGSWAPQHPLHVPSPAPAAATHVPLSGFQKRERALKMGSLHQLLHPTPGRCRGCSDTPRNAGAAAGLGHQLPRGGCSWWGWGRWVLLERGPPACWGDSSRESCLGHVSGYQTFASSEDKPLVSLSLGGKCSFPVHVGKISTKAARHAQRQAAPHRRHGQGAGRDFGDAFLAPHVLPWTAAGWQGFQPKNPSYAARAGGRHHRGARPPPAAPHRNASPPHK